MSKKIVLMAGAALMVVAGWLASAPTEADRVSPWDDITRSQTAIPKLVEGGYFAFPDSPLAVQEGRAYLAEFSPVRETLRIGPPMDIR
jgi:hypothetical protein